MKTMDKIQVIHLLTTPEHQREKKSIADLAKLCDDRFDYQQIVNEPYQDVPPSDNVLFNNSHWVVGKQKPKGTWGLTSGHYGCFMAHKTAIVSHFDKPSRWLLVVECDCQILNIEILREKIFETTALFSNSDYKICTFGVTADRRPILLKDDIYEAIGPTAMIGAQMYLIDLAKSAFFKRIFETYGWHTTDLWYSEVFLAEKEKMLVRSNVLTSQYHKGEFSWIDR